MNKQFDAIGRETVFNTEIDTSIDYTDRGLVWMEMIAWHGLLNSSYLYEFTKDIAANEHQAKVALKRHRKGGYIDYSHRQRVNDRACYNHYIYGRTKRADETLDAHGKLAEFVNLPSSNYLHQYGTGCVTGSIHLASKAAGVEYEPGHVQLAKHGSTLKYEPLKLIPDQLFNLTYPDGSWKFFAVEFDRSYVSGFTDNGEAYYQNKSSADFKLKIEKYTEYIDNQHYKNHLGIDTGIMVLFVFTTESARQKFLRELAKQKKQCSYILTQVVDGFGRFKPLPPYDHLFTGGWVRHGYDDYFIHTP